MADQPDKSPLRVRVHPLPIAILLGLCSPLRADTSPPEPAVDPPPARATRTAVPATEPLLYEAGSRAILAERCYGCHGQKQQQGGLQLDTPRGILRGGESGRVVVPGHAAESLLYELVRDGEMPPNGERPLTPSELEAIRQWIDAGARFQSSRPLQQQVSQHEVLPILQLRCIVCHGGRRQEAGLDLRSKSAMLRGGQSGPAIVPGRPEASLLLQRIRAEEMPPRERLVEVSVKVMEPHEINRLAQWIQRGAPEVAVEQDIATSEPDTLVDDEQRKFWAFQPPRSTRPRANRAAGLNPIDAFIRDKLAAQGLRFSPPASRQTLIRRVYFDLTGLPPAALEVQRLLQDTSRQAYEQLIDRLLASPHYGERWGRYWLDLAGYADSEGKREQDQIRHYAYRYRDYVIRAFNADKPYDRFLTEQLAGDELVDYERAELITDEIYQNLVATGFLRMAPDDTLANITNFVPNRLEVIADEVEVLGSAVLGLTLQCCRCHSHKFDPLPQRDYYRLLSIFKGAYDEHDWLKPQQKSLRGDVEPNRQRLLEYVSTAERQAWLRQDRELTARIEALNRLVDQRARRLAERQLEQRLAAQPAQLQNELRMLLATPPAARNAAQLQLAERYETLLKIDRDELKKADAGFAKLAAETERQVAELEGQHQVEPKIRALWDRGQPSPTYILRRGDYLRPGRLVGPGVPSVLTDGQTPFVVQPPWPGAAKTGRRLALARWLIRPEHPLTARVMVNRIWLHHFGRGLVATPANFGTAGARPTHPELLDWLAVEFVRQGWSVKAMHRLIMTSRTYRQSSQVTAEHERLDADNRLYCRAPLRRMDAEVVRDALLRVAGRLDDRPFGIPDQVIVRDDGLVTSVGTANGWRRSIFVQQRRKHIPSILEAFDLPLMNPNCIARPDSTVAPQALHLLNNKLIHELADSFAERVLSEVGTDPNRQITRSYWIALSRAPTDAERDLAGESLRQMTDAWIARLAEQADTPSPKIRRRAAHQALSNLCHALMNSAAFLYID